MTSPLRKTARKVKGSTGGARPSGVEDSTKMDVDMNRWPQRGCRRAATG